MSNEHKSNHEYMVAFLHDLRNADLENASAIEIEALASTLIERLNPIIDARISEVIRTIYQPTISTMR